MHMNAFLDMILTQRFCEGSMANYRFFNIVHPQESEDPLFPVLDSAFSPRFTNDDGDGIESFPIRGMFVLGSAGENTLKILSGSKDLKKYSLDHVSESRRGVPQLRPGEVGQD